MALNTDNMTDEEIRQAMQSKQDSYQAYQTMLSTPEGRAQDQVNQANAAAKLKELYQPNLSKDSGWDSFMGSLVSGIVDNIPLIYGAILGGGAMGLFGDATGAGVSAGSAAATGGSLGSATASGMGLGNLAMDTGLLQGLSGLEGVTAGASGLGGAAAAGGGAAGLGGLAAGIPNAGVVTIGAPAAAASGAGLGSLGSATAAGMGLGAIAQGTIPYLDSVAQGSPSSTRSTPSLQQVGSGLSSLNSLTSGLGSLGGLANGLGSIYGAYNDTKNNAADTDFYKNQLDTMTGMYKPGTPEATLMEQQMNAKDAAAGRNSQYGTRAANLAGSLAQQRANIMTSSAYQHTADMYRGKVDNNANPLLNLLGSAGAGGGGLGSIFGAIGNGVSGISNGLGALFGGNGGSSVPTNGAYAANDWFTS